MKKNLFAKKLSLEEEEMAAEFDMSTSFKPQVPVAAKKPVAAPSTTTASASAGAAKPAGRGLVRFQQVSKDVREQEEAQQAVAAEAPVEVNTTTAVDAGQSGADDALAPLLPIGEGNTSAPGAKGADLVTNDSVVAPQPNFLQRKRDREAGTAVASGSGDAAAQTSTEAAAEEREKKRRRLEDNTKKVSALASFMADLKSGKKKL